MTDHTSVVYTENETKLSCLIRLGVVYKENQLGQRRDQSIGLVYGEIETK